VIGSPPTSGLVLAADPESLPEVELLSPSDDGDVTPVVNPFETVVDTGTVDVIAGSMNATSEDVPVEAAAFPDQAEFTAAPDVPEDHELVDDHVLAGAVQVFVVGVVVTTDIISMAIGSMAKSSLEVVGATGVTGTLMFGVGMLMVGDGMLMFGVGMLMLGFGMLMFGFGMLMFGFGMLMFGFGMLMFGPLMFGVVMFTFASGTVTFGVLTPMFGMLIFEVGMLMLGKLMSGTVMFGVFTPMFGMLMSGLGNEALSDGRPRLNPPPHKIPNPHRIPNSIPKSPSNPHSTQQHGEQHDFLMVGSSSGARFL
jgi:hypothetical protein